MTAGRIAFVEGIDKYGAVPPENFSNRFAVLTWLEEAGSQVDPWDLTARAFRDMALAVGARKVVEEYWESRERGFIFKWRKNIKVLERPWRPRRAAHQEVFPTRFRFEDDETLILSVETEFWSLIGGPLPYHDSVTLSIFSRENLSGTFKALLTQAALELNYSLVEPIAEPLS